MVAALLAKLRHIIDLLPLLPSVLAGFTEYNCEATSRATITTTSIEIFNQHAIQNLLILIKSELFDY